LATLYHPRAIPDSDATKKASVGGGARGVSSPLAQGGATRVGVRPALRLRPPGAAEQAGERRSRLENSYLKKKKSSAKTTAKPAITTAEDQALYLRTSCSAKRSSIVERSSWDSGSIEGSCPCRANWAAYLSPIVNSNTWSLSHKYPNTTFFLTGVTDTNLISLPQVAQGGQVCCAPEQMISLRCRDRSSAAATRNGRRGSCAPNIGHEGGRSARRFRARNDRSALQKSDELFRLR